MRQKYACGWLLLWWGVYFTLYFLTERLIPMDACHEIHTPLDDKIPFCEWFVIFYVGWYGLVVGSLVWLLIRDPPAFCKLQTYIILVQMMATVVYVIYPSYQNLRPQTFPRENALTELVGLLYKIDTPTGVFPSLHVAISIALISTWLRERQVCVWVRGGIILFCLLVILSVSFVKQHSVLDILGAIPICLLTEWLIFAEITD